HLKCTNYQGASEHLSLYAFVVIRYGPNYQCGYKDRYAVARTERLTALKVARAKTPGMYADGGGLYLQVTEGSTGINKSWIYRFTLVGKTREMGLGPHPLYGLAEARALALDARRLRHQGVDPIQHRRAARAQAQLDAAKAMTFRQCADAYVASHRPSW